MVDFRSRAYQWDFHGGAPAAGDPRRDVIVSGAARGRQAVNLAILKGLRAHVAEHFRELRRFEGVHGKFARDRARTIDHVLRTLERVARLPADPATDYRGPTP
jgi:hypothetical protein